MHLHIVTICINNIHSLLATHDDTMGGYLFFFFDFLLLQEFQCIANINWAYSRLNMASWRLFQRTHLARRGKKLFGFGNIWRSTLHNEGDG